MRAQTLVMLSVAGTAFLGGLFLTVLRRDQATLENSFVDMSILPPVSRRERVAPTGTPLPPVLHARTLTRAESPYLLSGTTTIPTGDTVRAERGTVVLAAAWSRLVIEGMFMVEGSALSSNEAHPDRRLWHGLVVQRGGTFRALESVISDASAGITCAAQGTVDVRGVVLTNNAASVVVLPESTACRVAGATITNGRVGIIALGGTPEIVSLTLNAVHDGLRVFHEARPRLGNLVVRATRHAVIVSTAHGDLVIRSLALAPGADASSLIIDGADLPTHAWRGRTYPTGRVRAETIVALPPR